MSERESISQKAQSFFEELWKRGDPWDIETSDFEQRRCARLLQILSARRYAKALEVGCATGVFTRFLARVADRSVALDISPTAIACARKTWTGPDSTEFRVANIIEYDPRAEGPWDLVVMSDMIYFLGWLYPFFDVAWLAMELFAATTVGGQLLLANCYGGAEDYLMRPSLIRTYRDLFVNVGYHIKTEETFRGTKNGVEIEALITLFEKLNENTIGVR
ncbi:MAG TPA: SAM-dependent methyltransferase [Candidatus Binatia bacterium]|jgi:SAM-dependent methyltransferase